MSLPGLIALVLTAVLLTAIALWMRFRWFLYNSGHRRDVPVTPLRFLASIYSLLFFIFMVYGCALPVTILLYLFVWSKQRRLALFHQFLQKSAKFILKAIPLIDFTYINKVGETFSPPGVIISNHQGHLDLMCIMMMTPNLVVLTNERVWHNPLYGWIIRLAKFYPVTNGLEYNISRLRELIDNGYSVVVFPEGTRSPHCDILRFHTGAFYLARQLNVDIIPVILHGVGHCIPKEDFMLRPGHMYLEVMERIKVTQDDNPLYLRHLAKSTRGIYLDRFAELKHERETADYFAKYIINKYRYLSGNTAGKVSQLLRDHKNYTATVDTEIPIGETIIINDNSFGAESWLMALVHPQINVVGVIADQTQLHLAQATPAIPHNLKFTDSFTHSIDNHHGQ
ncbi:MAG: 1-acyl-sn-glycerol-3-phosphate acyltransferase [Bacteroides sp.]|nr:1-acyl-sn-glycerol-3-phosphate acyltransferase [Bacteroides sp.]